MFRYGNLWNYTILLLLGLITTLPQLQAAISEHFHNQRYDYIDVAKETFSPRSKGRTTRIFTTEQDLDEKFWLKYLGEEFNNAVHLEVDRNNNIKPVDKNEPQEPLARQEAHEKRTRFVRQPYQVKKLMPVKSQYPTEKPETFKVKQTTKPTNHTTSHKHLYTHNNKTLNNKNKLFLHNKYKQKIIKVKPSNTLKDIHEPIVVNLPETEKSVYQINGEQIPVVVQMPPVIYHQRADFYTRKNSNLSLNRRQRIHKYPKHIHTYTQSRINSNLPQSLQHEHNLNPEFSEQVEIHHQHPYQALALPSRAISQLPPASYEIPASNGY